MISFLAFSLPLALYLAFPSAMWNFDGVACAAALELGNPFYFFHANHLLYGFLGYGFWKLLAPAGLARALPALQLFTSLLASLGLVGVYRLTQPILKNNLSALLLTLGLSVTAAFWVWSVEAQVYTLGFLPLAWATYLLLEYEGPYKYIGVGLLHAGAVLGHLMHFLWVVPALYWMWGSPKSIRQYLAILVGATTIPYALVLLFVIAPGHDLARILVWLKGSVALTPDRSWAWHSAGLAGPWIWLKSTVPTFWGSFWPYGNARITTGVWMLTCLSIALGLTFLFRGRVTWHQKKARFAWLWLGVYGVLLSTWEPTTLCYRLTDVIPMGILLAMGLERWRAPFQILLSFVFFASTLVVNLHSRVAPMHDVSQNKVYQETLSLSKISPPNALYMTSGGLPWIYILYFTGRTAWNVSSVSPGALAAEITRQKKVRSVYVQKGSSWQKVL